MPESTWNRTLKGMPEVGATAVRTRRTSPRDVELFAEMTGDRNPLHFDAGAAARSPFGRLIVQGGVTSGLLNAVVAEDLPGPGTVFLSVEWRFVKAVGIGDEISARVTLVPNSLVLMLPIPVPTTGPPCEGATGRWPLGSRGARTDALNRAGALSLLGWSGVSHRSSPQGLASSTQVSSGVTHVRADEPICTLTTEIVNGAGEVCLTGTATTYTVPLRDADHET